MKKWPCRQKKSISLFYYIRFQLISYLLCWDISGYNLDTKMYQISSCIVRDLSWNLCSNSNSSTPTEWGVKLLSCVWLCNPTDYTAHGILQARILEWVVVPFSRGSSQPRDQTQSPALQTDSLPTEPPGKSGSVFKHCFILLIWDKTFCRLKLFLIGKKLNLKFYQSNNRDFSMNKDSNFNWKKSPTFCAIGAIKKI